MIQLKRRFAVVRIAGNVRTGERSAHGTRTSRWRILDELPSRCVITGSRCRLGQLAVIMGDLELEGASSEYFESAAGVDRLLPFSFLLLLFLQLTGT